MVSAQHALVFTHRSMCFPMAESFRHAGAQILQAGSSRNSAGRRLNRVLRENPELHCRAGRIFGKHDGRAAQARAITLAMVKVCLNPSHQQV
jgi:hypothetical protein